MPADTQPIGLAIVGSGRIGTLRARLAAAHPAVRFIAVSDRNPEAAKKLATKTLIEYFKDINRLLLAIKNDDVSREFKLDVPYCFKTYVNLLFFPESSDIYNWYEGKVAVRCP